MLKAHIAHIARLNHTTMHDDVATLATSAGRMVGTPGHRAARAYLAERLAGLGLEPFGDRFELPYVVDGQSMTNVIGVAKGTDRSLDPLVLAAHYDTCGPLPGADDNAAAVAIVLAIADRLAAEPAARDVIVALFDGEEPPHFHAESMGSIHWYRHQRRRPTHCAIVLDLVGHDVPIPGLEDLVFITGMESDPGLVFAGGDPSGLRVQPVLNRYVGDLSDHMIFRANQRPFLFLSCGRWQHYHAPTDTPDKLNFTKMAAIAELTETLVRRTSAVELVGPFGGGDSLALELAAARRHFGAQLQGRAGMDAFVAMAMASFGL